MLARFQPGTCGVAARLPKNPGTQKLTPPSSARAVGADNMAAAMRPIIQPGVSVARRFPSSPRDVVLAVIGPMAAPPDATFQCLDGRACARAVRRRRQ